MPYQSHHDADARIMKYRYWGNLSTEDITQASGEQRAFLKDMTGPVAIIADASEVTGLPPSMLTHARNAPFARYTPIIITIVGANRFIEVLIKTFNVVMRGNVRTFKDNESAEAYVQEEIARLLAADFNR